MEKESALINDFPREYIVDLYTRFTPEMVEERIAYIDRFVEENQSRFAQGFLEKNINGQKGLVHYEGKQFEKAAGYYAASVQKHSATDVMYFHEHCMVARCYRLAGNYIESEQWIMKAYAQKHLMPHVFELLDLLSDYAALLDDTGRHLPAEYQDDIEAIISDTGMEIAIDGNDLKATVLNMKKLNHETNIRLGKIVLTANRATAAEAITLLESFIRDSKIRFYREEAQLLLYRLKK